ncbi:MAG: hypothetical protein AAFO02_21190 [Bacteroidota bacterium]
MTNPSRSADHRAAHRTDLKVVSKGTNGRAPKGFGWLICLFLVIVGFSGYHLVSSSKKMAPGLIETPEGEITLSPERQAKLERELEEIDNAEQYALLATASSYYPCYSCPDGQKTIFLQIGEIWRYGVTRKGERGRYPNQDYGAPDLLYLPQFVGTLTECLKQEKLKIYQYPLLPEAQLRKIVLARPPGNKYDS